MSATWLSCYGSKNYQNPSKVQFRAVISNSLHPVTSGVHVPALEIMDATLDKLSFSPIGLSGLGSQTLGRLDVSSNKLLTLAYSPSGHMFALVDNTNEQASSSTVTLPDATESFFLANNTSHAYAAVPNATVSSGPPGAVIQVSVSSGTISATIPVPNVRFVQEVSRGDKILAFSPDSGVVTVIDPGKIGASSDPRIAQLGGFQHPVGAGLAADPSMPVILDCGAECGGSGAAAVVPLDLSTNTLGTPIPVPAATVAVGVGNTLYVAGTNPATVCSSGTAATSCGTLTVVDLTGAKAPVSAEIPDGYHDKIAITNDGQVAIGSHGCTEITTATETRGCLALFNPATNKAVVLPSNGDVTGIAPIPGRNVLYAIQGGTFLVYDTTTDKLLPNHQTTIVGELVDVKVIDNAP